MDLYYLTVMISLSFIEKDKNGDILWVWSYPTIDPGFRELMMHKCTLTSEEGEEQRDGLEYSYGHLGSVWYYLKNVASGGKGVLDKVCMYVCMNELGYANVIKVLYWEIRV